MDGRRLTPRWEPVAAEVEAVRAVVGPGVVLKVIIETAVIGLDRIGSACRAAESGGADFITGGVGDKLSLIVVPLVAVFGAAVPQMSGRGLGHTGGTLDKLEAIPGWRPDLNPVELLRILGDVGGVITAAGPELAPADRRLHALRDVTATVESIPLIASSIKSKMVAEGTESLLLDVKAGTGAFMTDRPGPAARPDHDPARPGPRRTHRSHDHGHGHAAWPGRRQCRRGTRGLGRARRGRPRRRAGSGGG